MRAQAKDTRPGQETHCAGGCTVDGLWRDFGSANSDLHERLDRIEFLLGDLAS